jgi:hypothetical protein
VIEGRSLVRARLDHIAEQHRVDLIGTVVVGVVADRVVVRFIKGDDDQRPGGNVGRGIRRLRIRQDEVDVQIEPEIVG